LSLLFFKKFFKKENHFFFINQLLSKGFEKNFIPCSFDLMVINKRNIFFRITLRRSITFRELCIIFPLHLDFTEDITIDEIKEKLFDYYGLNEIDLENFVNYLHTENNLKTASNHNSRKKTILKNLKILLNEILQELKNESNEFVFFGNAKKINKIFFSSDEHPEYFKDER